MSHSIKLNDAFDVIVLRSTGKVDFTELQNDLDELVRMPGFREGLSLVADFRGSSTPVTAAEIVKLADYAKRTDAKWGVTKWAIIAADDLTFGLTRMFMAMTEDYDVTTQVFRDAVKADGWLGLGIDVEEILKKTPG
jgi:hypothetical protein